MKTKREISSNYEKMKTSAAELFLRYDQETMIQVFHLAYDEAYLYISLLSRDHRINRSSGEVAWSEDGFQTEQPADYNAVMTIYDVLCRAEAEPRLAHVWVNVAGLSPIHGGSLAKRTDFFQTAGKAFTGRAEALARACEKLQGKKLEGGDAAYELPLFPFLPVVLRFWDADEEFPASLQLLVDQNILDYMHYETLMLALSHLLDRLRGELY